jgi:hypothetical protein
MVPAPAAQALPSSESDKATADAAFAQLTGETAAAVSPDAVAEEGIQTRSGNFVGRLRRRIFGHGAPPVAPTPPTAPTATAAPGKYIHENFLGWRWVQGVERDPALGRLPANASVARIIDQISGQFGVERAEVLELGRASKLDENGPREAWLAVYDRLQAINKDHFKRLDSTKYDGWSSFRELANASYAAGARGAWLRASEVHKSFLGAAVRFPYHLFDMFLFGYFRQAIAFEFFHGGEDFLALSKEPGLAKKWLESALRQQAAQGTSFHGVLRSQTWYRQVERWFIVPLAKPLTTFLVRRLTLAVMSAVAMGILGAFAPALPLSFALTAIPWIGPGIVMALNGLPVATAAIPLIGHLLAPVVSAAISALVKDLVLGPLLNTTILSTLLTFPRAWSELRAQARDRHPNERLSAGEFAATFAKAWISWRFWRSNLKSIFGLLTVGAEIAGIMTYAAQIDTFVDPAFEATLGHKVGIFEKIGASVERPEGHSPIPFGGAITWGNILLVKLQDASGIQISDSVMHFLNPNLTAPAAAVVNAAETRAAAKTSFDEDLWKRTPEDAQAKIAELARSAGGLDAELAAVKEHMQATRARLGVKEARLAQLQKQSRPVTAAEEAQAAAIKARLTDSRLQTYTAAKLAQVHDLRTGADKTRAQVADRLAKLKARVDGVLPPPPPERAAYFDQLAVQDASYSALVARLTALRDGKEPHSPEVPQEVQALKGKIGTLLDEIEKERREVSFEMTQREASENLIKAANKVRNHALGERRNQTDMRKFHTDFAKLATVMDLALSLNEIAAAQAAINQMISLLESKRGAVASSAADNARNLAAATADQAMVAQWTADANKSVSADIASQTDLADLDHQAVDAAAHAADFQRTISGFISAVNAMDGGKSGDAQTQYKLNLETLAKVKGWRTTGNPNDPSQFSLKEFQDDLKIVNDDLAQATNGLQQIKGAPVEFAGVLIVAVPGPTVSVTNPTRDQMIKLLADRRTYWEQQVAKYQGNLNSVNQLMDPNHLVVDEFGLAHGYNQSLQNMATLHTANPAAGSQADAVEDMKRLDVIADSLNAQYGAHIPKLSGRSLTDLQTTIKTYGDALKAVKFPPTKNAAVHAAEMDLISAAKLTPLTARAIVNWSIDQATIDTFNKAKAPGGALPAAQSGLTAILGVLNKIIADVKFDEDFVHYGTGGGQALIDRKTSLLANDVIPALKQAQGMLGTLIDYENSSIADVTGEDSQYQKLFSSEQTLLTQTQSLYDTTLPWALATTGGTAGDVPGSLSSIDAWNQSLQKYIDGYTDATGVHEGIAQYKQDVADRECASGCTRTEPLYGETQPYSLPQKIAQYGAEKVMRLAEMNVQNAQINEILGKLQALTNGKYNFSSYLLPTGVTNDATGVARVQAVVDAKTLTNLADALKKAAADAQTAGGPALTINAGGNGTVPVGNQPSPTISQNQQIQLFALDAAKRLVPSSLTAQQTTGPAALATARFLYADAVIKAAQDGLVNQVPAAKTFLSHASDTLSRTIGLSKLDVAYVNSNGKSETADAVYARKIKMYQDLDAFLREGTAFYALKQTWDSGSLSTISKISTYYDSLGTIYTSGGNVNTNEVTAIDTMQNALRDTYNNLEATRTKVSSWMSQLNPKEQSALRRVSEDVSALQDKTRAVLEANINWHDLDDQVRRSRTLVSAGLARVDAKQAELAALLKDPRLQEAMTPAMVARIESLRIGRGAWTMGGGADQAQALVVKKAEFSAFLDATLGLLTQGSQALAHQDVAAIKGDLLKNPAGLAAFVPGASVVDFGNNADGFYLVYQTKFAVPNGLETGSWVTLGNVAQLWGSNISLTGYGFSSPPSSGGENAPYGDKGVEVQVETLNHRDFVNYLNIDLHRFGLDIPTDNTVGATAGESRLMVLDDYALMLMGDKLYVGLAGFGDIALNHHADHPTYYGGNLKTSLRLNEVMRLNAEQQVMFARDPRKFLENVNLDFTGYDPTLNQEFPITAQGDNKHYSRTQIGPQFDLNQLFKKSGGDAFTLDVFYAKTGGTDDINQTSVGATLIKGFSLQKAGADKPWATIDNRLTAEKGAVANTLSDRITLTLPDKGIAISGEGRLIDGKKALHADVSYKTGQNSMLSLGYGTQYIGQNNRLTITLNSSFTLAELWQSVVDRSEQALAGGTTLKPFDGKMEEVFGGTHAEDTRTTSELAKVFKRDVALKLVSQDIGTLTRDLEVIKKAGGIFDNLRVRGMLGFTSRAVSNDPAELALGGGPVAGTFTELALTKTQKALIESKAPEIYRNGLRLQDRLLEITRNWQAAVVELAQAQWDVKLAQFEADRAPAAELQAAADARAADASARLHQALLVYNDMTGRDPDAGSPFPDLNAADLEGLMGQIGALIAAPDRFEEILRELDRDKLKGSLEKIPFNPADYLPWVDKFTFNYGVQYQDMLANQALTVGFAFRLPVYDPTSKTLDHAYRLQSSAAEEEIKQAYDDRRSVLAVERERAKAWRAGAAAVGSREAAAARVMSDALRGYRNGLVPAEDLRAAEDAWRWYARTSLMTRSQLALAEAQKAVDESVAPAEAYAAPLRLTSIQDAFTKAAETSHGLKEISLRSEAAAERARAADHRIQRAWVDASVSSGLTAKGLGWLPSIGVTGVAITPIFGFELKPDELRELQVKEHRGQQQYYDALKTRLEAGLAVQFYQGIVAYRAALESLKAYDAAPTPQTEIARAQAGLGRSQAQLAAGEARATLNLLLGRPADAELTVDLDETTALRSLQDLLKEKNIVENERRILQARVDTARAVEEMVDKNLKVDMLQLEPVSIVVRSLGRLLGALSDAPVYNPDSAAAARIATLEAERAQDSYDDRRAHDADRLRARLASTPSPAESLTLRAAILALGENPDASDGREKTALPEKWAELRRRLTAAEQALVPVAGAGAPEIPSPPTRTPNSGLYLRAYAAHQTLGHEPIGKNYVEGWVEIRLKDPTTPPEVLVALEKLRNEKAERIRRTELVGAAARADVLAAQFEADVTLSRQRAPETAARLESERAEIVSLLRLPPDTSLQALAALVPRQADPAADVAALAQRQIDAIRERQIETVRRVLFEDGLPRDFSSEDDIMQQIKANTIAERMSYKGFTPVLAAGRFRGTSISSAFLEAPDPRDIERQLETVMSDVLRKQLESDGRMRELSLNLHQLMSRVLDGSRQLEAQRARITAAENEVKAAAAQATNDSDPRVAAAQARVAESWRVFSGTLVDVKSTFIALVTELEALGVDSAVKWRPIPDLRRADGNKLGELVSYWTDRFAEPEYAEAQDSLIARLGPGASQDAREAVRDAAAVYRRALADADAVRSNDFTGAEKMELLKKNDVEGKRLRLSSALTRLVGGLRALDPRDSPGAGDLMDFTIKEAAKSAAESRTSSDEKRAVSRAMRRAFWGASSPSVAAGAAFARLDAAQDELDNARDVLLSAALTDAGGDARRFAVVDPALDKYLAAQASFDAELARALETPEFRDHPEMTRVLDAVHDVRTSLSRASDRARHGRGIDAINALVMLAELRLRAARWQGLSPARIDVVAAELQRLRELAERWKKGTEAPEAAYAVVQLSGGRRTGVVERWMTASDFKALAIIPREGRYFTGDSEIIGGLDAAESVREGKLKDAAAMKSEAELDAALLSSQADFVALGAARNKEFSFTAAFGPDSLFAQGRLFFFATNGDVLNPLEALSRPPEQVDVRYYDGAEALGRDQFPNLASLLASEDADHFHRFVMSAKGAAELKIHAEEYKRIQLRRGWLEVKLNSAGFARDGEGRMAQLYRTPQEYDAAYRAFKDSAGNLKNAKKHLELAMAQADKGAEEFAKADRELKAAKGQKSFDGAALAQKKAGENFRVAKAEAENALRAVKDAEEVDANAGKWKLYETKDLVLGHDESGNITTVFAPGFSETISDGAAVGEPWKESLAAAAVDERGRVVKIYRTEEEVNAALPTWQLKSFEATKDGVPLVQAVEPDGTVKTKVRFSHYETAVDGKPAAVLLSERYLLSRLDQSRSELRSASRWAVMPFNWINIGLEVPRGIVQAPFELLTGRDPNSSHYLGRVNMYRSEGGETDHRSLARTAFGWLDVLDVLPDPVTRYFDPSQFPDTVQVKGGLKPGDILGAQSLASVDGGKDQHFGVGALRRSVRQAEEDFDAARLRTLARFRGGVEETMLQSRRGRGRVEADHSRNTRYLDSRTVVEIDQVEQRLRADAVLAARVSPVGSDEVRISATPAALETDRVERRVTIYPGAAGFDRQIAAVQGYQGRLTAAAQERQDGAQVRAREANAAARRAAEEMAARLNAEKAESALWSQWHHSAARIGEQNELQRQASALESEMSDLRSEIGGWDRVALQVERARRAPPSDQAPVTPSAEFWAWVWALFGLGALLAAAIHAWRGRHFATLRP